MLKIVTDFVGDTLKPILAILAVLLVVVSLKEWQTPRTFYDPLAIAKLDSVTISTPEVLRSLFLDRLAFFTSSEQLSWRRSSLAPNLTTADLKIPGMDVTVGSLAEIMKTLAGNTDVRVGGELAQTVSMPEKQPPVMPEKYVLRLRISESREGWVPLTQEGGGSWSAGADVNLLLDPPIRALLLHADPLGLASYDYIRSVEKYRDRTEAERRRIRLCDLHQQGEIVDSINRCLAKCNARDKALAYLLWGDLLRQASDLRGKDATLLEDAIRKFAASQATARTRGVVYTHWAGALLELGQHSDAWAKFAEGAFVHADDPIVYFDWAEKLVEPYRTWSSDDILMDQEATAAVNNAVVKYRWSSALDPASDWVWTRWAEALLLIGRNAEAKDQFEKAVMQNGANLAAYGGLCRAASGPSSKQAGVACKRAQSFFDPAATRKPLRGDELEAAPPVCPPVS